MRFKRLRLDIDINQDFKLPTVKRQLANIISLALIPPNKIEHLFARSARTLLRINNKFALFVSYMEKTYIINSKYNQLNWNHYATLTDRPRTNNQ